MGVTSRTGSVGWDLRKVRVESCRPKKKGDFLLLAKALQQGAHVMGGGADEMSV